MSGRRRLSDRQRYDAAVRRQQQPQRERRDRDAWRRGEVRPYRITAALDAANLYGPEVDTACGVEEPAVDEWEAGTRYPTWDQLVALAKLTGKTPSFFTFAADVRPTRVWVCGTDGCQVTEPGDRVDSYDPLAVRRAVGGAS